MFVNASDNSTVFAVGDVPAGKNVFMNPTFVVDYNATNALTQGTTPPPPSKGMVRDRWMNFSTSANNTYSISSPQSFNLSNTITIPNAVHTTNGNPPSWPVLGQYVESGFFEPSTTHVISWEGTADACYLDSGTLQIVTLTANTIANSTRKWATLTSPASGNWLVGFQGPSSATGSVTVTNVKLEQQVSYHLTSATSSIAGGPTAFVYPDYTTELLKCQRYYYIAYYDIRLDWTVTATTQLAGACGNYATPLRIANPDATVPTPTVNSGFQAKGTFQTAGNTSIGWLIWAPPLATGTASRDVRGLIYFDAEINSI
jgi:hypothetical protein